MKRCAFAVGVLVVLALPPVSAAQPCGESLGKGVARAESARYVVAWRADPAPIPLSRHFALDVAVCPKAAAPLPTSLRVDATMPAHRHGMNYTPAVTVVRGGRFRVEGMLFHMPGAWELAFDVVAPDGAERVRVPYDLQ